jgi:single-stranded DNA-binding protein
MRQNSFNGVGRLLADPSYEQGDNKDKSSRCAFRLGINRIKSDKYDVINCVVWGPYADICANNLRKGKEVSVTGEIVTNSEVDGDGNWKNFWNVKCDRVGFGRDSAKTQRERAGDADSDDVAAALAAKVKAGRSTSSPLDDMVAKLVGYGLSKDEAIEAAKSHFAKQAKSTSAQTSTDDPFEK